MRRVVLAMLLAALAVLLAGRAADRSRAEAAQAAAMTRAWDSDEYNVLALERPAAATAGSSRIAELSGYFFSREPTAKTARTGSLAGRDLIVLLAENWRPGAIDSAAAPSLWRLWAEGTHVLRFYAPQWYQQQDGREFALLSGLVPAVAGGETSMAWVGEQSVSLPFALGSCLREAGYTCRAFSPRSERAAAYEALGFAPGTCAGTDAATVAGGLESLAAEGPFAAYFLLEEADGTPALDALWQTLERTGLTDEAVVCLVTGDEQPLRGRLFLWGEGLAGAEVIAPCSELDVTPTLLDLLGAAYDARFLFGRDLFADGPDTDATVGLYGSAYADWVTAAGSYSAAEGVFTPAEGCALGQRETVRYVLQMRQRVYDQYVRSQQAVECNFFRALLGK